MTAAIKEPRTAREALFLETLGELDRLITQVDALPKTLVSAEASLTATISALSDAGDKYRLAVTAFSDQAKADLTEFIERKALLALSKTTEEQRAAMQEAARLAFRAEAADKAAELAATLRKCAAELRQAGRSRLIEHAITALIAATAATSLFYLLIKIA